MSPAADPVPFEEGPVQRLDPARPERAQTASLELGETWTPSSRPIPPRYLYHWTDDEGLARLADAAREDKLPLGRFGGGLPAKLNLEGAPALFAFPHPVTGIGSSDAEIYGGTRLLKIELDTRRANAVRVVSTEDGAECFDLQGYPLGEVDFSQVDVIEHLWGSSSAPMVREWILLRPDAVVQFTADPRASVPQVKRELARLRNPDFEYATEQLHSFVGQALLASGLMRDGRSEVIRLLERFCAGADSAAGDIPAVLYRPFDDGRSSYLGLLSAALERCLPDLPLHDELKGVAQFPEWFEQELVRVAHEAESHEVRACALRELLDRTADRHALQRQVIEQLILTEAGDGTAYALVLLDHPIDSLEISDFLAVQLEQLHLDEGVPGPFLAVAHAISYARALSDRLVFAIEGRLSQLEPHPALTCASALLMQRSLSPAAEAIVLGHLKQAPGYVLHNFYEQPGRLPGTPELRLRLERKLRDLEPVRVSEERIRTLRRANLIAIANTPPVRADALALLEKNPEDNGPLLDQVSDLLCPRSQPLGPRAAPPDV